MRLSIIGKGAIGQLLALRAHRQGFDFVTQSRDGHAFTLQARDNQGTQLAITPKVMAVDTSTDADLIILPLKAYQIERALEQLKPNLKAHQVLILLHNGMGTIEQCLKILPEQPLIAATTSHGAYIDEKGRLIASGIGKSDAGWITKDLNQTAEIEALLSQLLHPCYWHQDVQQALWLKLAANAVINPLTAIHQFQNGQLALSKFTEQKQHLCEEIALIMNAKGNWVTKERLLANVNQVITDTANNHSSMKQDISLGRRTEIDFINGYIVKQGIQLGIATPANRQLWQAIKNREAI